MISAWLHPSLGQETLSNCIWRTSDVKEYAASTLIKQIWRAGKVIWRNMLEVRLNTEKGTENGTRNRILLQHSRKSTLLRLVLGSIGSYVFPFQNVMCFALQTLPLLLEYIVNSASGFFCKLGVAKRRLIKHCVLPQSDVSEEIFRIYIYL